MDPGLGTLRGGEGAWDIWGAWSFDPAIVAPLAVAAALYAEGDRRLHQRRLPRSRTAGPRIAFWLGLGTLAIALVSPLHALGEALFCVHMLQHTLLLLVATPLLVLGRPGTTFLWALPRRLLDLVGACIRWSVVRRARGWIRSPAVAWFIHGGLLWTWHAPVLYQATLSSEIVHAAQHTSFLVAGMVFWGVVLPPARATRSLGGLGLLYVFTTAVHGSLLAALLTFAPVPVYPAYAGRGAPFGLSLLEDQQLGGLLMWIPGGIVYLAAGLTLFAHWVGQSRPRSSTAWALGAEPEARRSVAGERL